MKNNINIEDLKKDNIFTTPQGYFENFSEKLLIRIQQNEMGFKVEKSSMNKMKINFDDIEKENIFSIPKDYFDNLFSKIQERIDTEDFESKNEEDYIEEDLGILSSIDKKNIFNVPDGYFENFEVRTENKNENEKSHSFVTKNIPFIPSWLTYSASVAAIFILMLVGYGFYKNSQATSEPCKEMLCNVSDEEILQYLDDNEIGVENGDKNNKTIDEELKNKSITEEEILGEMDTKTLDHLEN